MAFIIQGSEQAWFGGLCILFDVWRDNDFICLKIELMSHEILRDGNLHSAVFILEESAQVQFNFLGLVWRGVPKTFS